MTALGAGAAVPLRDIHLPPAPPWWPPAPGWWWVGAGLLAILGGVTVIRWLRHRRRRAWASLFDDAVAQAPTAAEKIAAMSDLLRRAARRIDPAADTLLGEDWLAFLDTGLEPSPFRSGAGALLRDGAYRRDVDDGDVDALRVIARARFLAWMAP